MDETSTRFSPNHCMCKCKYFYVAWLSGITVLACVLSFVGTSASALAFSQPLSASPLSIPRSAAPADWSTVQYGGVTLAVPASWPVYDLSAHPERCVLFNVPAVYLGQQGAEAQCPAYASGKSEALQLEPLASAPAATTMLATAATTIAGVPARVDPASGVSHTFTIVLNQPGVVITASYSHEPALARRILGTLRVSDSKLPPQNAPPARTNVASANLVSGVFSGKGFDACTAPSTRNMSAWLKSPYRAVGIYIGGANRACGDGNLSSSWVRTVSNSGWYLMPLYVGLQAPCNSGFATINLSRATAEGTQGADDAVRHAQGFGLGSGTLITFDIENYDSANASCSQAVTTFLSAWTRELHVKGYLSGVYSSLGSGIADLVKHTGRVQEPDTIFFARWNGVATTSDPSIPANDWASHQRIKQYLGGHNATYGGATINIDSDQFNTALFTAVANGVSTASNNGQQWIARREADGHIDLSSGQNTYYLADSTPGTPAVAFFKGQVFVAFKANDGTNSLLIDFGAIPGPNACPATQRCQLNQYALTNASGGGHSTSQAPAISTDGTTLYVAFTGVNNNILTQQTTDGSTAASWSNTTLAVTTWHAPSTTGCNSQQWVAYVDASSHLNLATSQASYVLSDMTDNAPTLTCFKGQVFVSYASADGSNNIIIDSGPLPSGTCTSSSPCHLNQYTLTGSSGSAETTVQPPSLASDSTNLYLAFVDSAGTVNVGVSTTGTNSASWAISTWPVAAPT